MKSTETSKPTTPVQPEHGDDKQPEVAEATKENAGAEQEDENSSARVTKKTSTASIHSHNLPYAHEHTHTHREDEAAEDSTPVKRPRAVTNKKTKIKMAKQSRRQNRRR